MKLVPNMTKSRFRIYMILLFIIAVLIGSCTDSGEKQLVQKPNLLFIFPDQLRNASIGINAEDPTLTPNIDKLATEGLILSNAITNFPLCSPTRAMLMTGKIPYNNSVLSNSNSRRYKFNNSWQRDDICFSDVLVRNGYDAGYVGKLHLTSPPPIEGKDNVVWDAYTEPADRHSFNFWYAYGTFDQHYSPHYWVNDANENELLHVNEWSPKHEAEVIIDYIENKNDTMRSEEKPFALFWSLNPPHPPYHYVPDQYKQPYLGSSPEELLLRKNVNLDTDAKDLAFHKGATRRLTHLAEKHVRDYFGMVTGVDAQIGRVPNALEKKGLAENTILIISSDHGEMMGSHGLMSKNV